VKDAIFYFISVSSALFLPMFFKHCFLKALIHSASDDNLVLSKEFKDEIHFQSPSGLRLSSTDMKNVEETKDGEQMKTKTGTIQYL